MTTFADLKQQIADELDRADLNSQIDRELRRSVQHYERQRWWFNEAQTTITTSSSLANYSVPSDFLFADSLELRRSGSNNRFKLNEISWERFLDEWRWNTTSTGEPSDWTYHQDQIWVGTLPSQAYDMTLTYVKTLVPASFTDGTQNVWTDQAQDLLVARTMLMIGARTLRLPAGELRTYEMLTREAMQSLRELNDQKLMTGRTRPWIG